MAVEAARAFDKDRKFAAFWTAEPVGAARWVAAVLSSAEASAKSLNGLTDVLSNAPSPDLVAPFEAPLKAAGEALTKSLAEFDPAALNALGWTWPTKLRPPMVHGALRLEPTTSDLKKRLVVLLGQIAHPLVCNNEPLESFAGDMGPFEGAYEIALVGWPDDAGQFFVEEAAPIVRTPGLRWNDWAQGRLYDNGDPTQPVALRINKDRQIAIADDAVQQTLRPFVGTGVVLYGNRVADEAGDWRIETVQPDLWVLTRLTNPADPDAGLPAAPRPNVQDGGALCIGATPPWNWQGPNVPTHLLCPPHAASLTDTEERRMVYGRILPGLPDAWTNTVEVKRVVEVKTVPDRPIDSAAHWATRRAPRGALIKSILGIALITSAEQAFAGPR